MNIIDKILIIKNPNIIETFDNKKLDNETIKFAIKNGYKFNKLTVGKFIRYKEYIKEFKNEEEIFKYEKQLIIKTKGGHLVEFYNNYCDNNIDEFTNILKNNNELLNIAYNYINIRKILYYIFNDLSKMVYKFDEDPRLIQVMIRHYSMLKNNFDEENKFAKYVATKCGIENILEEEFIEANLREVIIKEGTIENILAILPDLKLNQKDIKKYRTILEERMEKNILEFIPYMRELEKASPYFCIVTDNMKNQEIEYLKSQDIDTTFLGDNMYLEGENLDTLVIELESIEDVKKALEYIKANKINNPLTIILHRRKFDELKITENLEYFEELAKNNVNINFRYEESTLNIPLEKVLKDEEFLNSIAEEIKKKGFSPLEQTVAIYDIVKNIKPFKKGKNHTDSRSLYEYLNNNYIVCAGYADLFVNIASRLRLPCAYIRLEAKKGGNHARNYINLVDEKYGIDGFYILDPTWEDNKAESRNENYERDRSSYNKFLLTTKEGRNAVKMNSKTMEYDSFFTAKTPEELMQHLLKTAKSEEEFYNLIKFLDPKFYKKIANLDIYDEETSKIFIEYFKAKIDNLIPKEKILEAIITVKRTIYKNLNEQDFEDMRNGIFSI